MKKLVVIALAIVAVSCNGIIGDGYTISGEISGLADGTNVFLEKQDENTGMPITVDTVKVQKGKFTFLGTAEEPQIHNVRFENVAGGFVVVVEKGDIEAKGNKDSIFNAKVSGTFNNDELSKFNSKMKAIQERMITFEKTNLATIKGAQDKNDTVTVNKLRKEYAKFQDEFMKSTEKYIEESPKSFLSILLIQGMFNAPAPDLTKIKKYYDALDSDVKATSPGKKVKAKIDEAEKATALKKK